MVLRQSARSCSGDQPCRRPASTRPSPQLPGKNKKKNTSLTASAIEVARSIGDTTATDGTNGNKGDSSIKDQQGKVGGDNKCNNINNADIGKSDGEVGDDNDGDSVLDGNEVNEGGNKKVVDDNNGNGKSTAMKSTKVSTTKLVMITMAMVESTAMKSTKAATTKLVMIPMAMAESTAMKSTKVTMTVPLVMIPTLRMTILPPLEMRDS